MSTSILSSWKKISKAEKVKEVPKFPCDELKLSKNESNNDLSTTVSSGPKWKEGDIFIPLSLEGSMEVENKYRRQIQEKLIQILQAPLSSEEEAVPDAYEESILVEACTLGIKLEKELYLNYKDGRIY
jgi:hypothetical protein